MRKIYLRLIHCSVLVSGILYGSNLAAQDTTNTVPPVQTPAPAQAPVQTPALNLGEIHGNFQAIGQYYILDTTIGAPVVPEKWLMNGFANLIYTKGKFTAGIRYESYLNALQGFTSGPAGYNGNGIPYRFARYKSDALDITVGNFYEQFGNGLILRSYEERGLGFDNALDGFRIKYNVTKGISLTGFTGKQRKYMSQGPGILRGFDGEMQLNETFKSMADKKLNLTIGGSYVSRYQENTDTLIVPLNVGSYAARITANYENFHLNAEFAHKINDPNFNNNYIYRSGDAQLIAMSYAKKGLSLAASIARSDNMLFRSDRTGNARLNELLINYIPAINKQHTYSLLTFYPYASQPNGQFEFSTEMNSKVIRKKNYKLDITVNYSGANNLDTTSLANTEDTTRQGYVTNSYGPGKTTIFRDFFIELNQKFGKKIRSTFIYAYQAYNKGLISKPGYPTIYANIIVADVSYRLKGESSARIELQNLSTRQDHQSWAMALFEYTFNTHWFLAALDQYNYGNKIKSERFHYPSVTVGYTKNANRITLSYGKQREGVFCVGGVCRVVPASNGVTLTVSTTF